MVYNLAYTEILQRPKTFRGEMYVYCKSLFFHNKVFQIILWYVMYNIVGFTFKPQLLFLMSYVERKVHPEQKCFTMASP